MQSYQADCEMLRRVVLLTRTTRRFLCGFIYWIINVYVLWVWWTSCFILIGIIFLMFKNRHKKSLSAEGFSSSLSLIKYIRDLILDADESRRFECLK